jgi:atypical dual specificity phosphatase
MRSEPYLNFVWIEEGVVAGCAGPRSEADLAFLKRMGIRAIVRMYPTIISQQVAAAGLTDCLVPVEDFHPPLPEDIDRMMAFVHESLAEGAPVAVSCRAGDGRTGVVLGCYLVGKGLSAHQAIAQLWAKYPGYLETPEQEDAVYEYEERLRARS